MLVACVDVEAATLVWNHPKVRSRESSQPVSKRTQREATGKHRGTRQSNMYDAWEVRAQSSLNGKLAGVVRD